MRNELFNQKNQNGKVKKNVFDLTHEKKLSMNMGDLVPIYLQEVMPGDKFQVSTEQLMRLAPMVAPLMHRVNVYTHFFFVPNRLVFDQWQDFITGGSDGKLEPTLPTMQLNGAYYTKFGQGTLADYFGINSIKAPPVKAIPINALPFRAYQLIYNEYFRDQTLNNEVTFNHGENVDPMDYDEILQLRKRSWEKDYFTSALPWPQRGDDVMIPSAGASPFSIPGTAIHYMDEAESTVDNGQGYVSKLGVAPNSKKISKWNEDLTGGGVIGIKNIDSIDVQSTGSNGSINDLRTAVRIQEWLEKNARAGARYIEQILAHFNVLSSDARLQRPEFLGGGISPIVISEVLSTVGTTEAPQGNMSGHGISVGNNHNFSKFFEEHGYIIGIMSVLPRTTYSQGVPRTFMKTTKFDFPFPEFAHLGEQAVYQNELFADGTNDPLRVFGYQPRYSEYKFAMSTVHGDFRDTLNYWHMAREWATDGSVAGGPVLNDTFTVSDPTHRIFAVTDEDYHKLYVQILNKVTAIRPLPRFGNPSF